MMSSTYAIESSFHNRLDTEILHFAPYWPGSGATTTTVKKHFVIQERTLGYQFYSHFHPYVLQLVQRLLERSVSGLQDADTQYNTRAQFAGAAPAKLLSDGTAVTLAANEIVTLPDGTAVRLPDNTVIRFAGLKVIKQDDATQITPSAGTTVTLPDKTLVRRGNGTSVTLDGDAAALLVDGTPRPVLFDEIFSTALYNPSELVRQPYPVKDLDFTSSGAYAIYNWELFFHVPFIIGIQLSKNQRFQEAQRWFHYIFDPTDDSDGPTPERFWKVKPFQYTDIKKIEQILVNLSTGEDQTLKQDTINSIGAWKDAPFRPHVIARYRQSAYMFKAVMAYLDNLIAWGDSLFRQDTGESINEAMIVYVLAANILGPRPQAVPKKGSVRPQTYANLRGDLDKFGNVMREMEADIAFDLTPNPGNTSDNERLATIRGLSKALYFCVPRNDMLMGYWDTVADRLFKIRNSLNIQGIFRQLPLFEPPIDPALLARAAAAGLDVGAVVSGANQPLPLVRFQVLAQKAAEMCQEVKSLGNNLLSAIEKEDNERLAILRAKHERVILEMVEHVKYGQLQEATKSKEGLLKSLALAVQRYTYYERQLGKQADEVEKAIPDLGELDKASLDKMNFAMGEPEMASRPIEVDIAQDLGASGGRIISHHESTELSRLGIAQDFQDTAAALDTIASVLSAIPSIGVHATPIGVGATAEFGGMHLHDIFGALSSASRGIAGRLNYEANNAVKIGSYSRREQDWAFQSNLAAGEITQIFKQLRAAQIREAIAELELKNHRQQIKHAAEIERFLNEEGTEKTGKRSNKAFYSWMKREVKGLYAQCFQFAFDIARKAERALQHELGNPELSFLQFGYLAGNEGLLAGEKLYLDIKRMEMAYYDLNQREYELTKHVSLLQVDPRALLQLRTTGRCTVVLPEELFDMDGPGHYFRRIKSVAMSIPCVAGPYTGVNCTLTLLKSAIRKNALLGDDYARAGAEDDRFSDHFGSLQSIVTSSGQSDSGLFETNLRDERYLPFENSGVISEWQLQLPANPSKGDPAQFDYDTISDVILHIRYTAREGGGLLHDGAIAHVKDLIKGAQAVGTVRLFSVRHEFPTEWAKFQSQTPAANQRYELALNLREEHYPFWSQGRLDSVARVDILARSTKESVPSLVVSDNADQNDGTAKQDSLVKDTTLGNLLVGKLVNIALPEKPTGDLKLFFDDKAMADLWIAVTWSGE
jgi:hypothetical protein